MSSKVSIREGPEYHLVFSKFEKTLSPFKADSGIYLVEIKLKFFINSLYSVTILLKICSS